MEQGAVMFDGNVLEGAMARWLPTSIQPLKVRLQWRVQLVSATLYLYPERWSVSNGLPNTDQVHSGTEGGHLGSLAAWRVTNLNWPII